MFPEVLRPVALQIKEVVNNLKTQAKEVWIASINLKDHTIVCIVNHIYILPKPDHRDSFKRMKLQIQDKELTPSNQILLIMHLRENSRKDLVQEDQETLEEIFHKRTWPMELGETQPLKVKIQKAGQIQGKVNQIKEIAQNRMPNKS